MSAPVSDNLHVVLGGDAMRVSGYDIVIGTDLLVNAAHWITPLLMRPKIAIIADAAVRESLQTLSGTLRAANIEHVDFIVDGGESAKSFTQLQRILDWLLDHQIERQDLVIALGGGAVGDLCGFAASILRRGIRFIQMPTTLLAQVDSSVGGKTGINVAHGKNLIGTFHQPSLVLSDIGTLASLPPRQLRAGYAEIVKYGVLGDSAFFAWLEANGSTVLTLESATLIHAIRTSCSMKADIVMRDEREHGERALLNLGHSFGHAIETLCGMDGTVLHGEAIAFGMILALELSVRQGFCPPADAARLKAHLNANGLPTTYKALVPRTHRARLTATTLYQAMLQDKKVSDGKIQLILARGIGDAFITPIDHTFLQAFLGAYFDIPLATQSS